MSFYYWRCSLMMGVGLNRDRMMNWLRGHCVSLLWQRLYKVRSGLLILLGLYVSPDMLFSTNVLWNRANNRIRSVVFSRLLLVLLLMGLFVLIVVNMMVFLAVFLTMLVIVLVSGLRLGGLALFCGPRHLTGLRGMKYPCRLRRCLYS
jgi:hypothetical protein